MKYNQIILIGLSLRFLLLFFFILFPINHNLFGLISPLSFQKFADYNFFSTFGEGPFKFDNFKNIYLGLLHFNFENINNRYPGPLFSLIIFITNYNSENIYLMFLFVFLCEILSCFFWSKFLFKHVSPLCSLIFCILPIPLMFGFLHSSDVVFYLLSSIFLLNIKKYFNFNKSVIILLLTLLVLTRPSGIVFIIFSIYYFYKNKSNISIITSILLLILSLFYYTPYYLYEQFVLSGDGGQFTKIYITNYFTYYLNKFFLLFGFIKSDSGNIYIYLARCVCAVIFLVGYFYSCLNKNFYDILIINLFVLSILLFFFPAYRYILPIVPLLYMYCFIFFFNFFKNFNKN